MYLFVIIIILVFILFTKRSLLGPFGCQLCLFIHLLDSSNAMIKFLQDHPCHLDGLRGSFLLRFVMLAKNGGLSS